MDQRRSKKYLIYKLIDPNGLVYIGMTSCSSVYDRWLFGYKHNRRMREATQKYRWSGFRHEILFEGLSWEQACRKEIEMIDSFQATNPDKGYNISKGGQKTFEGLKHTEEELHKMSESQRGRKFSEETRKKMSESQKRVGHSGSRNPMYGKPKSEETIQKQIESHLHERKKIGRYNLDGTLLSVHYGVHETAKELGLSRASLTSCINGRSKTCGGYVWKEVM